MLCTCGAECILTKKTLMKLWTFKFLQMGFSREEEKVFFWKALKSHFVEARIQRISHHVSQKQMYGCSNQMLMHVSQNAHLICVLTDKKQPRLRKLVIFCEGRNCLPHANSASKVSRISCKMVPLQLHPKLARVSLGL